MRSGIFAVAASAAMMAAAEKDRSFIARYGQIPAAAPAKKPKRDRSKVKAARKQARKTRKK